MTQTLKLEISVSNIGEGGVISSTFATTEYVQTELNKKVNLTPEGKVDHTQLPDYTYIAGLPEAMEDERLLREEAEAATLSQANTYSDQKLSETAAKKADLVEGKIPYSQLPYGLNLEQNLAAEFVAVRSEIKQTSDDLIEQIATVDTTLRTYVDSKDSDRKDYIDRALFTFLEDLDLRYNEASTRLQGEVDAALLVSEAKVDEALLSLKKGETVKFVKAISDAIGGYPLHARIGLDNGDIVRSTVANNTVNPNVDMTGWVDSVTLEQNITQRIYNKMIKNALLTHKNLRDLGFKGDGSDESTLLQTIFDSLDGIDLDFGGLTISVSKQVNLINRERFKLRNGSISATSDFKSDVHVQPVVNISRSSHWSICDFDFDGNRFNRVQPIAPAEPVWHTLQIYGGCKNFYMQNVNLHDGLMENLYICGGVQPNWEDIPTGGTFINVNCDKGFRNSSAIIHGIDLVFINSSFTGSYGNAAGPCSGLDIESNNDGGALINLQFIGCTFEGNSRSQVQVSGKDYTRSIKFSGGSIKGGAYPESSPIVWYSSAAIFDGVVISGFSKTTGEQVIRIPSSEAGAYPDRFVMRNCALEDISAPTMPLFYVHSYSGGLDFHGNTVRNITCLELGHIYGGNNNISGNSFDAITGKNWQYDTVVSGNEPVVNISDNVFKNVTGSMRIVGKLYKNTFIDCGTDVAATYVARVAGTASTAIENKFIATTAQTKNALVSVDTSCASYNNTVNYSDPFSITNTNAVTQRTVAIGNTKDGATVNFDFLVNLGTQDLNTLYQRNTTFIQTSGANGTTARNYPVNGFYGTIQVVDITTSGDYVYCTQIATFAGEKLQWIRRGTRFSAGSVSWQAWDIIPNSSLASRGTTAARPTTYLFNGRVYFDTTLAAGGKPIWYTGGQWVDATGAIV